MSSKESEDKLEIIMKAKEYFCLPETGLSEKVGERERGGSFNMLPITSQKPNS